MYLNVVQIAESFGVSESVVLDWIRDNGLPHVADRGYLLFDRAQVANWAAGHGLTAQAGFLASEKGIFKTEFTLERMLRAGGIWREVPGSSATVTEIFERVVNGLTRVSTPARALLGQWLRAERGITISAAGGGFALAHFRSQVTVGRDSGVLALVLLRDALSLADAPVDTIPVTSLFFFVPPSPRAHLDILGRLGRVLASDSLRDRIATRAADEEILRAVATADVPASTGGETTG
jgi:nitrogen PTS system EIIA component